ncbi:transcriptional regulator [Gordonia sp. 852002-10350_SCH5691597]|nr:transcriptional regulator [Gordonia sp. 852002-10350_SCH5691597]
MTDTELMSIGAFAELAGITTSALRFYDDADVLRPHRVDPASGYRFYSRSQLTRATRLRGLRAIGMPLPTINRFFEATAEQATKLIDEQVAKVNAEADEIARAATTLKASLDDAACHPLCTVAGPVLAAAVHQVLTSTADDPDFAVLRGVRVEVDADGISLTATDRYRLTTRTLVGSRLPTADHPWAATVAGEDLAASTSLLRRSPSVTLDACATTLDLRAADGNATQCRLLTADFPDRSALLDSLAPPTHRVTVGTRQFLKALERASEKVGLRVADGRAILLLPDESTRLDGTSTGHDITIWFELTTLYPALSNALGSDVILDLRSTDQPATVRSADDGDLTTLVMPCRPN